MTPPPTMIASYLRFSVNFASAGITRIRSQRSVASSPPSQPIRAPVHIDDNRVMSLAQPESPGPLRRERLRTARLYFVCEARPGGQDPEPLLHAALTGGADIVQLREKSLPRRETELSALTFRRLCDTFSALFIVNDDPDLARACNADGVHLGQDDLPVEDARETLGPAAIVGLSTHSEEQIAAAAEQPVDYISVGPIWETPTKEGRPGVGLELVSHAAEATSLPFFAIGGIDPSNATDVVRAGARRLCVVRAIRDAEDPTAVAESLREAFAAAGANGVAPGG
jgi:thiamine-phosphate pyrophosphorylase